MFDLNSRNGQESVLHLVIQQGGEMEYNKRMSSEEEQVETSTFELSREAEEAAIKARNLRERIEKFFSKSYQSERRDAEEVSSDNDGVTTFDESDCLRDQHNLLEAIEQLEGAARALKEVSLESSNYTQQHLEEPKYVATPAVHLEESVKSQSTTEESVTSLEISDYEWEVLSSFRPSKALRERLLQNISQRRWRDEALRLVHDSKHLTRLWSNVV